MAQAIPVLETADPEQLIVAGRPVLSVETQLTGDIGPPCGRGPEPYMPLGILATSSERVSINPGDRVKFIVLEQGDSLPLIIRAEAPAPDFETAMTRLQPLLDSMTIGQ